MLDPYIFRQIVSAWSSDQAHPHRGRSQQPIPLLHHVTLVVEAAYLASLKREESRALRFAIVLLPSANPSQNAVDRQLGHFSAFHESIPFRPNSIAKLAPALDPNLSAIAVGLVPTSEGCDSALAILGVINFAPLSRRFPRLPVAIVGRTGLRPDAFTVYAVEPGSLVIARGDSQIGRLIDGEFVVAAPDPLTAESLGGYIIHSITTHALYIEHDVYYWHVYRDALDVLFAEVSARTHGAIIVIADSDRDGALRHASPRVRINGAFGVQDLFAELLKQEGAGHGTILVHLAWRKLLHERLAILGQMGAVDGALLLNWNLDLVGFGATLSAPPWPGRIVTGPDGFGRNGGDLFDHRRFGERHASAIAFAASTPGSVVFVLSQDGPLRAFLLKDRETLLCWPDCSVSMFLAALTL
jgi:hypothetical protein